MIKHSESFHGSDLEHIEKIYNIKKEVITSFSANVNPLGISPKLKATLSNEIDAIMTYPDREYTSLRRSIAEYVDAEMDTILVGNGSTELISLIMQIKKPKKALIIGPTYSEYQREIMLCGGSVVYHALQEVCDFALDFASLDMDLTQDIDLLVICNPNNPTSTALTRSELKDVLDLCKQRHIFVMVDETYVEFAEDVHNITAVPLARNYDNIIILRGISKFFAAPGLRLGYAICGNEALRDDINQRKNPWTINSLAAIAGEIMFSDETYINDTRSLIALERGRICKLLSNSKQVKVYSPTANFVLVKILAENITSRDLFEATVRKGLMIRDCSTFPFLSNKYIRFCFMSPEKNNALLSALFELLV